MCALLLAGEIEREEPGGFIFFDLLPHMLLAGEIEREEPGVFIFFDLLPHTLCSSYIYTTT